MKSILLSCCMLIAAYISFAQNTTYRYEFNNRLGENYYKGPELISHCSSGTYTWDALNVGISHNAYNFEKGCGLVFNDSAGFLASGDYTIEIYFKFDTTKGYKKIIDYDSMSKDPGFYNQNGKLVMYNNFTSNDSFFADGKYQYVAVTRNGTSKNMTLFYNDTLAGNLSDNSDQYVPDSNNLLIFFRDDNGTNGEQSGGAVAMIHISNYEMDAATINTNYNNLAATLDAGSTIAGAPGVEIYPNPVGNDIHIVVADKCDYTVVGLTGLNLMSGKLLPGDNRIDVGHLSKGMYYLELTNTVSVNRVYKILKM